MPLTYHLVDGYNLLHAAGLARATYGPDDYERVRFALLVKIAEGLDDASRARTTVVFDAFDPPAGAIHRFRFREMTVEFAVETGEADERIEQLIRRHPSPRQLRVVSDDIRLKQAAKRRGSAAVGCETFLQRLDRYRNRDDSSAEPTGTPAVPRGTDAAATGAWLDYFGIAGDEAAQPVEASHIARPEPEVETHDAPPLSRPNATNATSKSKPPKPDRRTRRAPSVSGPSADPPAEDLAFWQKRIEDALAEEQASRDRRRESS